MNKPLSPSIPKPFSAQESSISRRAFLSRSGGVLVGAALADAAGPFVHAAGTDIVRLALIGCGGRGSGAAVNAFESSQGPVKLIAMADFFENRLDAAYANLSAKYSRQMEVPLDRRFTGFNAWRQAIDCLRPGDVAMLCGYAGFRPQQLEYAVEKGVNVFMEKSFATDPPAVRRVIQAGAAAEKKNLKIAAGLQCRHSRNRHQLIERIRNGELGDLQLIRAYRMQPCGWLPQRPPAEKELFWQIRHFTDFFWVSGGLFAEMNIHQIDEICWLKDAYPVSAHGVCGRAANNTDCGQGLDSFTVEWTFADGAKALDVVRWLPNCHEEFATYVHGTKCAAQFSGNVHEGTVHTYKNQRCDRDNIAWQAEKETVSPWQAEWDNLLQAIRQNQPHNEAKRAALSNLADIIGRAAMHSGKVITWDEAMASNFSFCPNIDTLTEDSPPPVQADAAGHYPVPIPGKWTEV
ncbi:MAG TPA: Gfo/Idh/MocA family oxidoreductase [Candidatus Paceibacterota bacterium]|nr:Gfo/Idh/MocA family oxidoreductase [Verrucomicrobiota bacterium]HRY51471.1 Gfo/Idh/MocA family oxidoreductase [Candidatus Paceibacterota bacterium]HRZ99342.1 Gfo/Idh/MocA family oxidoreductase [Candidatus Paceibacterota bacterium]